MGVQVEHEHWFVDHEDPRWLVCDCGQYAVRARNIAGDRIVRLIDPPKPVFPVPADREPATRHASVRPAQSA